MNGANSAPASMDVGAAGNLRPNCMKKDACDSRGPGRCRRCAHIETMKRPEVRAKISASQKARLADPLVRARHAETARANLAPHRASSGRKRTLRMIGHIPEAYRDEYRRLVNTKKLTSAEARAVIEAEMQAEGKREVARNAAAMREKHQRDLASRY
ncbi:hypothetical protein [Sphingomonas oleivorans]|nr:hypothetical protein [Sphingomonas oleivorans]